MKMSFFNSAPSTLPGLLLLLTLLPCVSRATEAISPEAAMFFEKKIRPVLADKCYQCHGAEAGKPKGGLALDTHEGMMQGGSSGPAVTPGKADDSLLMEAIRYENSDSAMPPRKSGGKLPDSVIADFATWINMGAPDPRIAEAEAITEPASTKSVGDYGDAAKWWAWQLPKSAAPPVVKSADWPRGTIDNFVMAALEAKEIKPVADADPATWLRRMYFDLIGLPPRPQEVVDFVKDWQKDSQVAMTAAVDRVLATPQYGERWGRHWLDVSRYAESTGKDLNSAFPHAWRYRDYVIKSFNDDKPFDRFLHEQLAGDLLPASDSKAKAENLVATGFLALGPKSLNEMNPTQFALDLADEQIDTVSQAFLATTIACARCHDHKFDPIPQKEYYALAGIFLSTDTKYGTATAIQNRHATDLLELPDDCGLPTAIPSVSATVIAEKQKDLAKLKQEQDDYVREQFAARRATREAPAPPGGQQLVRRLQLTSRIGQLEAELKTYDAEGVPKILCMGVQEQPKENRRDDAFALYARRNAPQRPVRPAQFSKINDSALYIRGDVDKPKDSIPRGFVTVLSKGEPQPIAKGTSGRLELAQWMTSPGNPLTARVMVNRVWNWVFGQGLVSSVDNFGTTGTLPSNQALLDYLALHFSRDLNWSVKSLVRELVLSHAYALSSQYNDHAFHVDPENALCWRMSPRRLEAECIRDAILTVSGAMDLRPPVGSSVARFGDGPIAGPRFRGMSESALLNPQSSQRSIYLPAARDMQPEALDVFDGAEGSFVTGRRDTTNTPSQALFFLNSPFVAEQAEKFATKLLTAIPPSGPNAGMNDKLIERVRWAYGLCFSRSPTEGEIYAAQAFFSRISSTTANDKTLVKLPHEKLTKDAWTSFCRSLMASAEFRELN